MLWLLNRNTLARCPKEYSQHVFVKKKEKCLLALVLLIPDIVVFANSVDPDQLASEEAN